MSEFHARVEQHITAASSFVMEHPFHSTVLATWVPGSVELASVNAAAHATFATMRGLRSSLVGQCELFEGGAYDADQRARESMKPAMLAENLADLRKRVEFFHGQAADLAGRISHVGSQVYNWGVASDRRDDENDKTKKVA